MVAPFQVMETVSPPRKPLPFRVSSPPGQAAPGVTVSAAAPVEPVVGVALGGTGVFVGGALVGRGVEVAAGFVGVAEGCPTPRTVRVAVAVSPLAPRAEKVVVPGVANGER